MAGFAHKIYNANVATWLRGLWGAIISGGTSGIIAGLSISFSDPQHFAVGMTAWWNTVGTLFASSAFVSLVKFLNQQPLPPPEIPDSVPAPK